MITCTHKHEKGRTCTEPATAEVSWTVMITTGWYQTNHRSYCEKHSEKTAQRLADATIACVVTPFKVKMEPA